jgi:hypothetical protein
VVREIMQMQDFTQAMFILKWFSGAFDRPRVV